MNSFAPRCNIVSKLINFLRQHIKVKFRNRFPRYRYFQLTQHTQKQLRRLSPPLVCEQVTSRGVYILAENPYLFPLPHLEKSLLLPLICHSKIPEDEFTTILYSRASATDLGKIQHAFQYAFAKNRTPRLEFPRNILVTHKIKKHQAL